MFKYEWVDHGHECARSTPPNARIPADILHIMHNSKPINLIQ